MEELPTAWVPVDACRLPTAERPLRVAEFDALFAAALRDVERRGPGRLRLRLAAGPGVRAKAEQLIGRESECCSFFDFELVTEQGALRLDVHVPDSRVDVLDGLARRVETISRDHGGRAQGFQ